MNRAARDAARHRANHKTPFTREQLMKTPPRLWIYRPDDCDARDMQPTKPKPIDGSYVAQEYVRGDVALQEADKEVRAAINIERDLAASYLVHYADQLSAMARKTDIPAMAKALEEKAISLRTVSYKIRTGAHAAIATNPGAP